MHNTIQYECFCKFQADTACIRSSISRNWVSLSMPSCPICIGWRLWAGQDTLYRQIYFIISYHNISYLLAKYPMEYSVINHIHSARFRHMRGINSWSIQQTRLNLVWVLGLVLCTKVLFVFRSDECLDQGNEWVPAGFSAPVLIRSICCNIYMRLLIAMDI